jgi:hypothetical protein
MICLMIRLTYVSTCVPGLSLTDVRAILAVAKRANQAAGVTGMLYWSREFFMQTLEGDRAAVTDCFLKLSGDPRHTHVELIRVTDMHTRWFSNWSMGFTQLLASHRVKLSGLAVNVSSFNPYLLDARDLELALAELAESTQTLE